MITVMYASWGTIYRAAVFSKEIYSLINVSKSKQAFLWYIQGHEVHGVFHQWTGPWELFCSMPGNSHIIKWIFGKAMYVSCTFQVFLDSKENVFGKHISFFYKLENHKFHPYLFWETNIFDVASRKWTQTLILWFNSYCKKIHTEKHDQQTLSIIF